MPLQNRVDPAGTLHAVAERGMFTGNRGVIHDPDTRTLLGRRWTTKAWIICDCGFQGRRRDVFGRNARSGGAGWTNLFFLDEVTALSAGHRPCFECRRAAATRYAACFAQASGLTDLKAAEMDRRLHAERLAADGTKPVLDRDALAALPAGAMCHDGARFVARGPSGWLVWSFSGYRPLPGADHTNDWRLVTPPATLGVLAAGYSPVWHPSAIA